jgi:hypothetical protein
MLYAILRNKLIEFCERNNFQILTENTGHTECMELNNGGSHVCIETVYHKNLVLRGHNFMLVTKLNSINLE